MKEYTIMMKFSVETENDIDYEKVSEFAEQLTENIMGDDKLVYGDGIEIVGVQIDEVENLNYEEDDIYLNEEDEM
jgi:hypothetical protein